ncbi:hypothetical protein [Mycolicibacterium fortuitum]|uniref:hypothetical protein n=1 Tax=Mycolicibacterium fortuitum TaxID=1766 RepID=UPI001AEF91F0|nr:hypothetical protein [Mycolicibacterium fortuitum]MBP3086986.1 hypothetical protein [Mycolicibacterium fortuitum]
MIAGFLRGAADFWDAVQVARAEQRTGFSEREAGDYLDTAGLGDQPFVPNCGERPPGDAEIPTAFPIRCDLPAAHVGEHISYEEPDRAILRWPRSEPDQVSHEDLAAHITAIRNAWFTRTGGVSVDLNEEIARDLLSDYRITKK